VSAPRSCKRTRLLPSLNSRELPHLAGNGPLREDRPSGLLWNWDTKVVLSIEPFQIAFIDLYRRPLLQEFDRHQEPRLPVADQNSYILASQRS